MYTLFNMAHFKGSLLFRVYLRSMALVVAGALLFSVAAPPFTEARGYASYHLREKTKVDQSLLRTPPAKEAKISTSLFGPFLP